MKVCQLLRCKICPRSLLQLLKSKVSRNIATALEDPSILKRIGKNHIYILSIPVDFLASYVCFSHGTSNFQDVQGDYTGVFLDVFLLLLLLLHFLLFENAFIVVRLGENYRIQDGDVKCQKNIRKATF